MSRLSLLVTALFLGMMVVAPLCAMLFYDDAAPLWQEVWQEPYYRKRLVWTVFQAALTAILTTLLALLPAWTLARLDFHGRQLILRLLMLPFIMPTLVAGMGVLALFGHRGVLWQGWQDTPYLLLYGNVFFNLPVAVLAAYQGFCQVPASRLYAARTLGANAWQNFWHIELPIVRTWLSGSACLVFLYCFSGFGLALLLGGRNYATAEVEVYQLIAHELDMARAAVLVCLILSATAIAGILYALIGKRTLTAPIQSIPPQKVSGSLYALPVLTLSLLLFCCGLPLLAIFTQVLRSDHAAWSVLWDKDTLSALWNTLQFSASAIFLSAILGMAHATAARYSAMIRALTFLPFMVSPVCLAFGILLLYPQWAATLPMLIAIYALLAYPFVTQYVLAKWDSLPENIMYATRLMGASPFQAAYLVYFPLLLPALRRGLAFTAAACIGEFAASLFLSRPEWTTLSTLIYRYLGRVGTLNYHKALILTLLLMVLACLVFWVLTPPKTQEHKSTGNSLFQ
ncbi:MAG: iron ABC transporter permease [Alysiella sp.]|uniref:ABC transporter permease n=1 Tax=Alysiella sp. TaxID=1872483 RepID=UPI0026DB5A1D|nr:iron ABC transporter permease [Alysiella sp.]MDO4433582.1 iron ABC transporter permease [Alysiella sp.]